MQLFDVVVQGETIRIFAHSRKAAIGAAEMVYRRRHQHPASFCVMAESVTVVKSNVNA